LLELLLVLRPVSASAQTNLPALVSARQVHQLSPEEAVLGYPVQVQGVITYVAEGAGQLFVQDDTGGIFVEIHGDYGFRMKTGQVLVIGTSGCEIYNPSANRFVPTGGMIVARAKFGAALLANGKVLVAGGQVGGAYGSRVASTEIYDPASGTFAPGPDLNYKRFKLARTVLRLRDGRILVGGGDEQPEVYVVVSRRFVVVDGHKLDGFLFSTATLLKDGRVLLAGGYSVPGGPGVNHAWLYQP